jgi:hypothetical protein
MTTSISWRKLKIHFIHDNNNVNIWELYSFNSCCFLYEPLWSCNASYMWLEEKLQMRGKCYAHKLKVTFVCVQILTRLLCCLWLTAITSLLECPFLHCSRPLLSWTIPLAPLFKLTVIVKGSWSSQGRQALSFGEHTAIIIRVRFL